MKALILDDDASIRFILSAYLQHRGIETESVESVEEAEKVLAQSNFDLIVSDDVLTGSIRGSRFLAELSERNPHPFRCLMSGTSVKISPPVQWFLLKPFAQDKIEELLEAAKAAPA